MCVPPCPGRQVGLGDDPIHDDGVNFAACFAIVKPGKQGDVNLTTIFRRADTALPAALLQAFEETEYRVFPPAPMVLKIGEANAALLDLYAQFDVDCAAFVTACNPLSAALSDDVNVKRQAALGAALQAAGLQHYAGEGKHPANDWPGEASFLILGLDRVAAARLGSEQEQNAVVWCGEAGVPELLLLR